MPQRPCSTRSLSGGRRARPAVASLTDSAERHVFRVRRQNEPIDPTALVSADRLVVVVSGDVDLATAPSLRRALESAIDVHPDVCCDLREVTFFSAAGISALVYAWQRAERARSRFHIRGAGGITRRILRITGLETVLSASNPGGVNGIAGAGGEQSDNRPPQKSDRAVGPPVEPVGDG